MEYANELAVAREAVRRAGRIILDAYADFKAIPDARADISTEADRQSQETILSHLHQAFPLDALCAEERTPTLAAGPNAGSRIWIVDPIDGTRGFAKKNGEFTVMVALLDEGRLALGLVLEPAADRLTFAVRGGGCWREDGGAAPRRCDVSRTTELAAATLVQSHTKGPGPSPAARALKPGKIRETYSAGLKLALVARGDVDTYVNDYAAFHDWDIAAGHILVEEAGGTVTGLRGQTLQYGTPGAWQRHGLLATNRLLHPVAVAALALM
jgi:3'(2'), 5'-bisphosphate nucleotidase